MTIRRLALAFVILSALAPQSTRAFAQGTTSRLALVISEAQYRDRPLATSANDGGLMADLLRQAGFDVTGAANLSQDQIRQAFREFLEKAAAVGPSAEIFVYLSGKGLQFAGDNYLAPIESAINNAATVPAEAVRLSDFIGPLSGLPARARIIVLDLARPNDFGRSGEPLASGLALVDAPANTLVAFNTAPGTIAPDEPGPYGAYAQSLVATLKQPGLPLNDVFAQVRLRVNEATRGGQTPWHVTQLNASLSLFEPAPGVARIAPPPANRARRPRRDMQPQEAYGIAVEADTFEAYNDFVSFYPGDPLARRVRAMLAARREALTWRSTYVINTPDVYWTYLQRYPRGPHAPDARRRLAFLSAPIAPPARFRVYEAYDVPPPPPEEIVIIDRPRFFINEVVDVPPPRFSPEFLPVLAPEYRQLPQPAPQPRMGFLPIPVPIPLPFARPQAQPGAVTAPRFYQPAAQSGGAGQNVAPPQGYSATPVTSGRPAPTVPAGTPAGAQTGTPAGTQTGTPAGTVVPSTQPSTTASPPQTLPRPTTNPADTARPNATPDGRTSPTRPADAQPGLRRQDGSPVRPAETLPDGTRPGTPAGTAVPSTLPSTTASPPQALPRPTTNDTARPNATPDSRTTPTRPADAQPGLRRQDGSPVRPAETLPDSDRTKPGTPAARTTPGERPGDRPAGEKPAVRESTPAARPADRLGGERPGAERPGGERRPGETIRPDASRPATTTPVERTAPPRDPASSRPSTDAVRPGPGRDNPGSQRTAPTETPSPRSEPRSERPAAPATRTAPAAETIRPVTAPPVRVETPRPTTPVTVPTAPPVTMPRTSPPVTPPTTAVQRPTTPPVVGTPAGGGGNRPPGSPGGGGARPPGSPKLPGEQ